MFAVDYNFNLDFLKYNMNENNMCSEDFISM